jgi:hypothetical protein
MYVSYPKSLPKNFPNSRRITLSKQSHSSFHQLKITLGIRIAIVGQVKDLLLEIGAISSNIS